MSSLDPRNLHVSASFWNLLPLFGDGSGEPAGHLALAHLRGCLAIHVDGDAIHPVRLARDPASLHVARMYQY